MLASKWSVQHSVQRYLPEIIAENSLTDTTQVAFTLSPWAGLGLLCLYAPCCWGRAGWLLARRMPDDPQPGSSTMERMTQ